MYVGRVMRTELITVHPDMPLSKAKDLIAEKQINHLLVVNDTGELTGILSDRDIKQSWASSATTLSVHELNYLLSKLTVGMVMAKKIISIPPNTTIERAALIMQQNRINALPVIDKGKLAGIITTFDVMSVLLEAIGIDRESFRFTVLVRDRIGFLDEITKILKENEINIRSIFSWPEKKYPGIYQLVLRVGAQNGEKAVKLLQDGGFKVLTDYADDLTPYLPGA
jgi:acetoin utilization protein AcuB